MFNIIIKNTPWPATEHGRAGARAKINNLVLKLDSSFYLFNNFYSRNFNQLSLQKSTEGVFIIIVYKALSEPISSFLYLDIKSNQITKFKVIQGRNFYSQFTYFISKNILNLDTSTGNLILVPKFYINKSLEARIKKGTKLKLDGYTNKTSNYPIIVDEIKALFKNLLNIDESNVRKLVNNFNKKHKKLIPLGVGVKDLVKHRYFTSPAPAKLSGKAIHDPPATSSLRNEKRLYSTFDPQGIPRTPSRDKRSKEKLNEIKISQKISKWREFSIILFGILDNDSIKKLLDDFWVLIAEPTFKAKIKLVLAIQLKIELDNGDIRSISTIDLVQREDLNTLKEIYWELWSYKAGNYSSLKVSRIYLWYRFFIEGEYKRKISSSHILDKKIEIFKTKIWNSLIPKNMDINTWGEVEYVKFQKLYKIKMSNSNLIAHVTKQDNSNLVSIFINRIGGLLLLSSFTDTTLSDPDDLYTFKRELEKRTIYYNKGEQICFIENIVKINWNFIKKFKIPRDKGGKALPPSNRVITMDLETREIDSKMEAVCLSISYVDRSVKTFGIWDYKSSEELIKEGLNSILTTENDKASVYFHNFSGFDSIFILKILSNMEGIKASPIFRDGKLISLKVGYKTKENLTIFDSLLLLPSSLEKLAKAFKIEEQKGFFPLKILNDTKIDWDYKGGLPPLKYFHHPHPLNKNAYQSYIEKYNNFYKTYGDNGSIKEWILKEELVKYCENDVIVLHSIIISFSYHIFDAYEINIQKYPTLPSIAFAIYRAKYLKSQKIIPIVTGKMYTDIKQGYYGGFVDIYIPFARSVKSYDINSLYPSIMSKCDMPVGIPTYFEGDSKFVNNLFGFVFAKIESPKYLKTPILPFKIKQKGASTTIYPLGTWSGWYFTEELNNAKKYGYKFEILKGYTFNRKILFDEYVGELYEIKCSVSPSDPWYIISKILLNSLYGRFGMSPYLPTDEILSESEFNDLIKDESGIITDSKELGEKFWVSYFDLKLSKFSIPNVSVPIAAAISAWSRIEMTKYVIEHSDSICCIDTDGCKITSTLDPSLVGKELGKMKFEGEFIEAVFIAPKVYGGITTTHEMVVKVKGLKSPISYWELKSLLYKNNLKISQYKWYRNFSEGTIKVLEQIYTLASTGNKRELIWNSFGEFVGTLPYKVLDGVKVNSSSFVLFYLPLLEEWKLLTSPSFISLSFRISSPPVFTLLPILFNIIYLPAPLPAIIFIPVSFSSIIYLYDPIINRLTSPYLVPIDFRLISPLLLPSLPIPLPELVIKSKPVKSNSFKVIVYDSLENNFTEYSSIRAAARSININESSIRRYIKSNRKTLLKCRYSFSYATPGSSAGTVGDPSIKSRRS